MYFWQTAENSFPAKTQKGMPRSSRWMVQGKSRSCLYLSKTVARGGYLYGLRRVRAFVHLCFRSSFPVQNARREAENI